MWNLNLKTYAATMSPEAMEARFGKLWEQGDVGKAHYHRIRKIRPKQRALRELGAKAVLSGVRADQTENRARLNVVELAPNGIYEIHPLLGWTQREVEAYFLIHSLPRHPLVAKGYSSIGDTHSTRRGEGRAGRLLGAGMECGVVFQKPAEILPARL